MMAASKGRRRLADEASRIVDAADDVASTTSETQSGPHAMFTCCAAVTYVVLSGWVASDAYDR